MNYFIKSAVLLACFLNYAHAIEAASINLDNGISIKPLLNITSKYDDNIYHQPSNLEGDSVLVVSPSVDLLFNDDLNQFKLDMGFVSGTYLKNSDDNYLDHSLNFLAHFSPSSWHRFDILASANNLTEPRGTGVTEGISRIFSELLVYKNNVIGGIYEFGALSSKSRIAFEIEATTKKYDNFKDVTKFKNNRSAKLGTSLFYKMDSSTDLFVVVSRDDIKYDHIEENSSSRDSTDDKALLGVQWEMTSMTTGVIKIGYQNKVFGDFVRQSFSGKSWEAKVQWQPLTYTNILFETSRSAKDPNSQGDYVNKSVYGLTWNHSWNEKLRSNLGASFSKDVYKGVYREDGIIMGSVSFSYLIQRWLEAEIFIEIKNNDSTTEEMSFDKNLIGINFNISI